MIRGIHAMFNTTNTDETRAFLRDKLGIPWSDVGEGWLIFDLAEAEVGCHPAESNSHDISFYTDDVEGTIADLQKKGVVFKGPIQDLGWGRATMFEMPGGAECMLYEPRYETRHKKPRAAARTASRKKPKPKAKTKTRSKTKAKTKAKGKAKAKRR